MEKKYNSQKSKSVIGNPPIKIIFLKTVVGYEKKVYEDFKKFLNQNGNQEITDWWAYKLFGEYDLCFIIKKESINHDISYAGTITGIIYATEMLCYLWGKGQESNFNQDHFNKPLIGISILKLKPACLKEKNIKIEQELSNLLKNFPKFFCLGSFGWGEFVLMYPCNAVKEIYDPFLENIFSIHLIDNDKEIGLFLKTFTLVGVNYNILSPLNCSVLKKKENFFTNRPYPSLSVSCRPSEINTIMASLQRIMKLDNKSKLSLGMFDFTVEIKKGNWGDFIEQLIRFREGHKESVFKTSAQISGFDYPQSFDRAWKFAPFYIPFRSDEVKNLEKLGHPAQESILSTIYTFNQYMENELLAECIEDMIDYVVKMVDLTRNEKTYRSDAILEDLENMPDNIKYGCNQRISGFLLQEGVEDFSPFKGGKQRILKSLKALCKDIMEALNIEWTGYVVIGRQNSYDHAGNILSIPVNATFDVKQYFGLFHELGHVIITNKKYVNEYPLPDRLIKLFYDRGDLSREIFCDLFDFQCGFLGDFKLYKSTVPNYLAELVKKKREPLIDLIEEYVLRFLCVTLYQLKYPQKTITTYKLQILSKKTLTEFLKKCGCLDKFKDNISDFVSRLVYSVNKMKDIILDFSKVYEKNWSKFCDERYKKLISSKFKNQFKKILKGQIIYDLEHPQLVVLAMLKEKQDVPFRAHVAAIQSFLNCYYKKDWDGTYFPYIKVKRHQKVR